MSANFIIWNVINESKAALDVFIEEPPSKDSKLVQHENVIVTPHLGASTVEAQEGVAIEIAEAVVGALQGELSATAVNAPMVPAEVRNVVDEQKISNCFDVSHSGFFVVVSFKFIVNGFL